MIRGVLLASAIVLGCSVVHADEWKIYDKNGHKVGRIEDRPYGRVIYDTKGNRLGTIEKAPYGDYRVYDRDHRYQGRVEELDEEEYDLFSDDTDE